MLYTYETQHVNQHVLRWGGAGVGDGVGAIVAVGGLTGEAGASGAAVDAKNAASAGLRFEKMRNICCIHMRHNI